MPLYDLKCRCGYAAEVLTEMDEIPSPCPRCGGKLERVYSAPPMVKMKGEGGYPSRRRQVFNTTKNSKPKLEHEANKTHFG